MNVAGLSTRLPNNPLKPVPSGLMVHKLWIGMAGRSTYSQRLYTMRPSAMTDGVKSFR